MMLQKSRKSIGRLLLAMDPYSAMYWGSALEAALWLPVGGLIPQCLHSLTSTRAILR